MARTAVLVKKVTSVDAETKILASKLGRYIPLAQLPCWPACADVSQLLALLLKWIFCKLICLEQSNFPRYQWFNYILAEWTKLFENDLHRTSLFSLLVCKPQIGCALKAYFPCYLYTTTLLICLYL
jgi:hypothetical protein